MSRGRNYRRMRAILLHDATNCFWCKEAISVHLPPTHPRKSTADHLIPVVEGGPDTLENLVPACRQCNLKRGAKGTDWRPGPAVAGADDW